MADTDPSWSYPRRFPDPESRRDRILMVACKLPLLILELRKNLGEFEL